MRFSKKSNSIYSRMLIWITLLIVLIIVVSSSIQYISSRNEQLSQIYLSSRDNLSQIGYSANFMVDSAKSLLVQMNSDLDVVNLLYYNEISASDMQKGLEKLYSYNNSMPFVHSIYLYNSFNDCFYTSFPSKVMEKSSSFFDQEIVNILSKDNYTYSYIPLSRRIMHPNSSEGREQYSHVFTFLFGDSANVSNSSSLIVLNLSELWVRKVIDAMDFNSSGSIFITDSKGNVVSSMYNEEILTNISDKPYFSKIFNSNSPSGYFLENVEGKKSLVIYIYNEKLDWKFVRIIPYNTITSHLKDLATNTIIICSIILFIGLLASFFVSKSLYRPIGDIVIRLDLLAAESRKNSFKLKQEYLRNLLQSETPYSMQTILKNFSAHDINLKPDDPIALVLLQIDHFSSFCLKYNFDDRNLIKYGVMNIASELCLPALANETVDMGENYIVLLLNTAVPPNGEEINMINDLIMNIQANVEKYLEVSLSATISTAESIMAGVNDSYTQALTASSHRFFYGQMCIIEAVKISKNFDYSYPFSKEKLMLAALTAGKVDDVKSYFNEIVNNSLSEYTFSTLSTTLMHITFSINMSVDNIVKSTGIPIDFNFSKFNSELTNLETLQDMYSHFYKMFDFIIDTLAEKKSSKYDIVITNVERIISESYSDQSLCLEKIADTINMSATYLGRLFKKHTLKSVADYINECRMEKAAYFLQTTDLSINDVAEKSGFSSSNYFYAVFKKSYGITPNEYRQKKYEKPITIE